MKLKFCGLVTFGVLAGAVFASAASAQENIYPLRLQCSLTKTVVNLKTGSATGVQLGSQTAELRAVPADPARFVNFNGTVLQAPIQIWTGSILASASAEVVVPEGGIDPTGTFPSGTSATIQPAVVDVKSGFGARSFMANDHSGGYLTLVGDTTLEQTKKGKLTSYILICHVS